MTDEVVNGLHFDRSYWPKPKTAVDELTLATLWDKDPDLAEIFVAEALIDDVFQNTYLMAPEENGDISVCTSVWSVGGDTMVRYADLADIIRGFVGYDRLYGPAQVEDLQERIAALEKIEQTISETKNRMAGLIADYQRANPEG